jgi:hypothetical protein
VRFEALDDELGVALAQPASAERGGPVGARQLAGDHRVAGQVAEHGSDVERRVARRLLDVDDPR